MIVVQRQPAMECVSASGGADVGEAPTIRSSYMGTLGGSPNPRPLPATPLAALGLARSSSARQNPAAPTRLGYRMNDSRD